MQLDIFSFDTKESISPEVACAMKKYISVLLAVLVFVLGMIGGMTEAAILNSSDVDKLNSKISSDATSGLFDDDVICSYKVDGAKDFKEEKSKTNRDAKVFKGNVDKKAKIRIHGIMKPVPLDVLNEKRKKNKEAPYTNQTYSATIYLQAKNEKGVINEVRKAFKQTLDNYIDYQVPSEAKEIVVQIKMNYKLNNNSGD